MNNFELQQPPPTTVVSSGDGRSIILETLLQNPSIRIFQSQQQQQQLQNDDVILTAGSIGLIVGLILASILLVLFFLFIAYCFPYTRCYLACSICVNWSCLNCIFYYYVCCPCLDLWARRRVERRRSEKRIYIQDMLATPDGKIIHMSNVGRICT